MCNFLRLKVAYIRTLANIKKKQMNNKLTILFLTFLGLLSTEIKAQCTYQSKIQEFQRKANSVSTKEASNGSDGYRQYTNYYTNLCYCEQSWSDADLDQLVTTINASVKIINSTDFKYYSLAGKLPQMTKAKCKEMAKGGDNASTNSSNATKYSDPNAELKSTTLDFMNELAAQSKNERIQLINKNLNEVDEWIDVFKTIDPANSEGFDKIENIAMGIGIIHGLFKKKIEQTTEKKRYQLQDGSFVTLTDEEVRQSGIKILLTPNIEPSEIKNELLNRSNVAQYYEKRLGILYELYSFTNKIGDSKVEEIKLRIYKNSRENNASELKKAWIELYELFDLPKVQSLIIELKKNEDELETILRQIYIIQKEIYLQLHYDINQPKWTKDEILDFYKDLKSFSDKEKPYMTTFDNPNSYSYKEEMFHELCPSIFVKNELSTKYNYIVSQDKSINYILKVAHESSGMTRLLPILLFHKSDKTALDYVEFLLEEKIFNSPFDTPVKVETTGVGYTYYFLLENCLNVETSDIYDTKNDSLSQLNKQKYRIAVTEFCPFNKENRAKYLLERLDVNFKYSWQTDFNLVENQIKRFSEKPTKDYEKQKKNQNKIGLQTGWTGLLEDFFTYSFLFHEINTEKLDISYLSKINELIQVLETPYNLINLDPNSTLSSFLGDKILPFSRLYIFRYYLEKTNNITTHTEHDKKYILDNYYSVLQDYYRFEKNTDALNYVLQDITK